MKGLESSAGLFGLAYVMVLASDCTVSTRAKFLSTTGEQERGGGGLGVLVRLAFWAEDVGF